MNFQNVIIKLPRARKASEFTIYPWVKTDKYLKLQSENHCLIFNRTSHFAIVSKRFNQYPRFEFCHPDMGGKEIKLSSEEIKQILSYTETGKTVVIVG